MKKIITFLALLAVCVSGYSQVTTEERPVFYGVKLGGNTYWLSPSRTDSLFCFLGASGTTWRLETSADTLAIPKLVIDTSQIMNWDASVGPIYWSDTLTLIATINDVDTSYNALHNLILTWINDSSNVLHFTDTISVIATKSDIAAAGVMTAKTLFVEPTDTTLGINSDVEYFLLNRKFLSADLDSVNLRIGWLAGDSSRGKGFDNVYIGYHSGWYSNSNTQNTFVGAESGRYNKANQNSFYGAGAGETNTTGAGNCYFGAYSGQWNTLGYSNSFFGAASGQNNTQGYQNTFIGASTGNSITTQDGNTFLGYYAGQQNTGEYNTFLGNAAGAGLGAGTANVLIGSSAMGTPSGSDNVVIGAEAGGAKTGSYNVFLGRYAGKFGAAGNSNTYMGWASGLQATGSENIVIGANALYNTSTASNILVIHALSNGNQFGSAALDTTESIIYGRMCTAAQGSTYNRLKLNSDVVTKHRSAFTPSDTAEISTTTKTLSALQMAYKTIRIQGDGGAVDTLKVSDGTYDGQELLLKGEHDTYTVTLVDGQKFILSGGTNFAIGDNDTWYGFWDAIESKWIEISRSDN